MAQKKTFVSTTPFSNDYLNQTRNIFRAHQILFGPLSHFYWRENRNPQQKEDLSDILHLVKRKLTKLINVIIRQRNEVSHQNYPTECYELDTDVIKLVAKLFSDWATAPDNNNFVEKINGIFKVPIGTSNNVTCDSLREDADPSSVFPTRPSTNV